MADPFADALSALTLLQHGDSQFPSGGFAYSGGLEGLLADGLLHADALPACLRTLLATRWAGFERVVVAQAWAAAESDDLPALALEHRADIVENDSTHRARAQYRHHHGDQPAARRADDGCIVQASHRHEVQRVVELDWNQSAKVDELTLICMPARHFSGRFVSRNNTLWASWAIIGPQHRAYFGGDTGYTKSFSQIGADHGPFDLTLMPIGAYNTAWPDIHMNPEEAVRAHLPAELVFCNHVLLGGAEDGEALDDVLRHEVEVGGVLLRVLPVVVALAPFDVAREALGHQVRLLPILLHDVGHVVSHHGGEPPGLRDASFFGADPGGRRRHHAQQRLGS